jgi:glucose-6-phosphate 1-dehydrogenase
MFDPILPSPTSPSCIGRSVVIDAPFAPCPDPCSFGERMDRTADALVLFGITGDLARKMTLPALYRLEARGLLPCPVLGVGRREGGAEELRARARAAVEEAGESVDPGTFDRLADRLGYVAGDVTDPELFRRIREALGGARRPVFYLAVPPSLFGPTVEALGAADLAANARVVIEKPFGGDLPSARELNRRIRRVLDEDQVYRIDHFLGKEPVQDIVYLRFANEIFEPVWNRYHVSCVQINMAEDFDVADRGSFYDPVGALRDVVQNHLLQILALVTMEPPAGGRDAIADRRLDVLRSIPDADPSAYVRGQYEGYRDVKGVAPGSETETFAALRLEVDNWRWAGVPFLIRTGKALPTTGTEVDIRFRLPPAILMGDRVGEVHRHNHITLRIGPEPGASLGVLLKEPGRDRSEPVHLDLSFREQLGPAPAPYERLLFDAIRGDGTLFPRQDVIEETWRILQPLLDAPPPVEPYGKGSWGPDGADRLAAEHGGWRNPGGRR